MTKRQKKLKEIDELKRKTAALQKEFEELVAKQEKERDDVKKYIDEMVKDRNLFCGVIITEEDLLNIIKLKFANPKESIKIKYNLYIEEPEDKKDEVNNGTV